MGNIGDTITETAPAVGSAGPTYATTINALLTEFRNRMIARIPLSSLLANSNLDMNGQAILNVGYATMTNESVSPVASPVNRVAAYAGNLWWVSPSGAVQLTSGAALNAAGVGGITGDYSGAGPMEFRYDTANTRYDAFANQSTNTWAYVRARGFDVAGSATSAFRARLLFGGGANVSYTLPAAAPASTHLVTMDSAGQLAANSTLGVNNSVTVSGTGDYKHGQKLISFAPLGAVSTSGTFSAGAVADVVSYLLSASGVVYLPLYGLREGDRIVTVKIKGSTTIDASFDLQLQSAFTTNTGLAVSSGTHTSGAKVVTLTPTAPGLSFPGNYDQVWVKITANAGASLDVYQLQITFDRP